MIPACFASHGSSVRVQYTAIVEILDPLAPRKVSALVELTLYGILARIRVPAYVPKLLRLRTDSESCHLKYSNNAHGTYEPSAPRPFK